ncbi:MAG: CHRD domain-containing protein [Chloroflexota bacterium]|nr:CHRD domain-containing protein [Chloroflexota bacterium]
MRASVRTLMAILVTMTLLAAVSAGSVMAAGGRSFTVELTGAAEPQGGDPDATGTATVTINPGLETVCYSLSWANASGEDASSTNDAVWGGHIHMAPAGTNGGIFVHLFGGPPATMNSNFGTTDSTSGCVDHERDDLLEIIRDPELFYVNIHSGEYPGGIIRGQLG